MARVIIFQKSVDGKKPSKRDMLAVNKSKTDDVGKYDYYQHISDVEIPSDFQTNNSKVVEFSNNSFHDKCQRFKSMIESIKNKNSSFNMIGVFGMNSDTVISETLDDVSGVCRYNKIYYDGSDIYNWILTCAYERIQELNRRYVYTSRGYVYYQIRDLMAELEGCQENYYDEYTSSIQRLNAMSCNSNRPNKIVRLMENISRVEDVPLLINIEFESFDYKTLKKLSLLNTPHLIIVVSSMIDYHMISANIEATSMLNGRDCLEKFFSSRNLILAG